MHRKRRVLVIAVALVCLAFGSYFIVRGQATKAADRDIDVFFRDFARGDTAFMDQHLKYLAQSREIANAIISRHKETIAHYDYASIVPSLSVTLSRTAVPVSWDLTIVFSRHTDGWYVSRFDEYVRDSKKA